MPGAPVGRVEVLTHPGLAGRRRVSTCERPPGLPRAWRASSQSGSGNFFISILQEGNGGSNKLETWGRARVAQPGDEAASVGAQVFSNCEAPCVPQADSCLCTEVQAAGGGEGRPGRAGRPSACCPCLPS